MLEKTHKIKLGRFRNCEKVLLNADRLKMLNGGEAGSLGLKESRLH
jgi:hypothetical protein